MSKWLLKVLDDFRAEAVSADVEINTPRTVRAAGNLTHGAAETCGGITEGSDPSERRELAFKVVVAALYMWHFWGAPSKELAKYVTSYRNSRSSRLRN